VGESPAIAAVREQIGRWAPTPSNLLIMGERGVGSEVVAATIHAASARWGRPFVAVNCGAIPGPLMESQLFGHIRGAFTAALRPNPGLLVAAGGGTLFLADIDELALPLQVRLLRVIENREVSAVGAAEAVPINVRIIASTTRDLRREVEAGRFREDLYDRLGTVHIALPPLRERRADIPLLVDHLLHRLNARLGTSFVGVEREDLRVLVDQPWWGNVREIESVLERAMVPGGGGLLSLGHLGQNPPAPAVRNLRDAVRQFVQQHVRGILAEAHFDKREAARMLKISLASLYRKLGDEAQAPGEPVPIFRPRSPEPTTRE
jgi:DNA-binding NtrC family response regulator